MAGRSIVRQLTSLGIAVPGPAARLKPAQKRQSSIASRAAVEATVPAEEDNSAQTETPTRKNAPTIEDDIVRNRRQPRRSNQWNKGKRAEGGNDGRDSSSLRPEAFDRAVVKERSRLLLNGEAVGLTMKSTPADLAAGFKGLRPLAKELRRQNQTLLFFPSTRAAKPNQSAEPFAESADNSEPQQQERKPATSRELDLALVAVPYFQKPDAEVTIRVGARSKSDVIARTLTGALLRSSSVAVHAAGPAAALVALQAAAKARRAIGAEQQLDLAFSIEYLRVPALEAIKLPGQDGDVVAVAVAAAESAAAAAAAAATGAANADAPADVGPGVQGEMAASSAADATVATSSSPEGSSELTSILQFSFYKRALPTPEVLASDFAATRSGPAMAQLLTRLISERREVDLLLESRDALFVMQTLARVVRDSWSQSKASVGVFLTSLEYQSEEDSDSGSNADAVSEQPGNNVRFTARLQLRRILGAPNLVPVKDRRTLLGVPVGTVKWDSPIGALGGAMVRELYSAGIFSVWPQEGVCVARMLRALWKSQQTRAATAAAAGGGEAAAVAAVADSTDSTDSDDIAAAAGAPSSSLSQIALVPELQEEGSGSVEARDDREDRRRTTQRKDGTSSRQQMARSTVLHLLEVSPAVTSTLRSKDGRVVVISGGEQLHQLIKAVVLRNRMYGSRQGGKLLTLRPLLDDSGALAVRFHYIDNSAIAEIPMPPGAGRELTQPVVRPRRQAAPPAAEIEDGYATDDEFGVGAEAAVLVPVAAAGAAAAAAAASAAGITSAGGKSPWIMFATSNTSSTKLAMGIVAETCKPYDRLCPIWLKVRVQPDTLATAALSVAMSQAQVQERANVELLVLPVMERKRDEQNRPYNTLTWQLIKYGPGAELGAAAVAAAAAATQSRFGPSAAAMAAAAAAAAKVQAQGDALINGTRKLW
ncbi:hypothetical protein Vafri_15399 [Volvox africanus]|uniref:Uncharacterized protein n=1 Tax=Volvox africanus TaxID=51714 RepID=A0A8J4F8R5_9CHLO|nr:hypothetical protein Vafri_15399 [Volvox africanus]